MHKAPTPDTRRAIVDNHGRRLGTASGFKPDPSTGSLGIELELTSEICDELEASVGSVWVPERHVMAVRRDRITLDLSREEVDRLVLRSPVTPRGETPPVEDRAQA